MKSGPGLSDTTVPSRIGISASSRNLVTEKRSILERFRRIWKMEEQKDRFVDCLNALFPEGIAPSDYHLIFKMSVAVASFLAPRIIARMP